MITNLDSAVIIEEGLFAGTDAVRIDRHVEKMYWPWPIWDRQYARSSDVRLGKGYAVAFAASATLAFELVEAGDGYRLHTIQEHLTTLKL